MVKIAPSILSADFGKLADEIRRIEKYVDMLHIDVMDGHFVPNITFGPPVIRSIRVVTKLPFDVHLMVTNPDNYVDQFIDAGANLLSVHVETAVHLNRTISNIKKKGAKAGVVLNPSTPLSALDHVLSDVDMVLIMTVNPGFGGQSFIKSMLPKIRALRQMIDKAKLDVEIEVDGGINEQTILRSKEAGATRFIATSYLFHATDPQKQHHLLKNVCGV